MGTARYRNRCFLPQITDPYVGHIVVTMGPLRGQNSNIRFFTASLVIGQKSNKMAITREKRPKGTNHSIHCLVSVGPI